MMATVASMPRSLTVVVKMRCSVVCFEDRTGSGVFFLVIMTNRLLLSFPTLCPCES